MMKPSLMAVTDRPLASVARTCQWYVSPSSKPMLDNDTLLARPTGAKNDSWLSWLLQPAAAPHTATSYDTISARLSAAAKPYQAPDTVRRSP